MGIRRVAEVPIEIFNQIEEIRAGMRSFEIPRIEAEERLAELILPYMSERPSPGDHTEIRVARRIQIPGGLN